MALEDRGAQHDKVVVDKFCNPNANYQMTTRDYVVRPSADGDSGAITITLPPVAEAKGRWYSILVRNADAVNTVTLADRDDSECWGGDVVMNGRCDRVVAYSDGLAWFLGATGGWPGATTTWPPGTTPTPTTAAPTTRDSSTAAPTTISTDQGSTTAAPTTAAPTTVAPTTLATTVAPTTAG